MTSETTRIHSGLRLKVLHAAVDLYRRLPFPIVKHVAHRIWERMRNRERVVIATIDGITYELDLRELIDSHLYYAGGFEPASANAIRKMCRRGHIVLDIGANVGCHTLTMARLAGATGRVFAFEPMPWARAKLEKNLSLNSFSNVRVVKLGLSDTPGVASVHFRSSWSLNGAENVEAPESTAATTIEFVRLDDYVAAEKIRGVDFVKLDVDGYEPKVLRGARKTLADYRPTLLMELARYPREAQDDTIEAMLSLLAELGYSFFREADFSRYPSIEAVAADVPSGSSINVIASCRPLDS